MLNKKLTTTLSTLLLLVVIFGVSADSAHAKKKKKSSSTTVSCNHSCSFTATKDGVTYTGTTNASYTRQNQCSWPSWGCDNLRNEVIQKISPTALTGSWAVGCGNVHSYSARVVSVAPTQQSNGGGGGCAAGQYYCDVTGRCVNNASACNQPPGYEPFEINPNIPADVGPVKLKGNLVGKPPVVNPGGTCVIEWGSEFESYDRLTVCTFTAPNVSVEFAPGDKDAPLSASILNVQNDSVYKMVCRESDGLTPPEESEGVCRINLGYKEIN